MEEEDAGVWTRSTGLQCNPSSGHHADFSASKETAAAWEVAELCEWRGTALCHTWEGAGKNPPSLQDKLLQVGLLPTARRIPITSVGGNTHALGIKINKGTDFHTVSCGWQSSAGTQPAADSSLPRKEKFPRQHKPQPNLHIPHTTPGSPRPSACATVMLLPHSPHLLQAKLSSSPGQEDIAQPLLGELIECQGVPSQ